MAENINFNKTVYKKRNYQKTIDTSFKELGVKTIQEQIDEQPTVQEFFDMYNTLFYEINEFGSTNSHEFLIKTSQAYIGSEQDNEIITLLQAEIANLREQLLESKQQLGTSIPEASSILSGVEIGDGNDGSFTSIDGNVSTPSTSTSEIKEGKVINDFQKYPNSTTKQRSKRLGYTQSFILKVQSNNDL
jgi:hypothetical protein